LPRRDYDKLRQDLIEKYPDIEETLSELLTGLQETNKKLKTEKEETEKVFKTEKEELEALRREKQEREQQDLVSKGEYEKALDRERKKIADYEAKANRERDLRHQHMIDAEMTKALAEHRGNVDYLGHHVRQKLAVIDDNGKEIVVALGDDGKPATKDGKYVQAKGVVETFKSDQKWAGAFEGSNQSGYSIPNGNRNGSANGAASNPYMVKEGEKPNFAAQAALEASNRQLANQYRQEAGKPPLPNTNMSLSSNVQAPA
jgi:hypothetical protein